MRRIRIKMVIKQPSVFISIILFLIARNEVLSASCPASCECALNKIEATCRFDNSSVHMTWDDDEDYESKSFDYDVNYESFYLVIECKGLTYNCTDMPTLVIKPRNVKLNITSCAPSMLQCVNNIYLQSKGLETLLMNAVKDIGIDDFQGLTISYLDITLTDDDTISLDSIPDVPSLSITGGNLQLFPNMFMNTHQKLTTLMLTNNVFNNVSLPPDAFNGLNRLKRLIINDCNIEYVPATTLRGLDALESFTISTTNKLKYIDVNVFAEASNLNTIFLRDNALESIPNELFLPLNRIESITIHSNSMDIDFGSQAFSKATLNLLEVTHSKIVSLSEGMFNGSGLKYLYFNNNMIEKLPPMLFWGTAHLRYIYFNGNKIKALPKEIFSKLKYLIEIDFSSNNIESLPSDLFASNSALKFVTLNNNNIMALDLTVFNGLKLITVSVNSNKMQRVVANKSLSLQIRNFTLNDNDINELGDWLVHTTNLNLTRNKLKTIKESHIYLLPNHSLITVDLRNNSVSNIIKIDEHSNTSRSSERRIHLYLSHNNFQCDCTVTTFLRKWNKDGILIDYQQILCENDEPLSKVQFSSVCNKTGLLITLIGSSTVGALALIILAVKIVTSTKNILRFIRNLFSHRANALEVHQKKLDKLKTYDVFVSFAHQDYQFVSDILLPKLENEFNQKVCVHYRDWVVGHLIPDQIIQSVENSRITIIILTEHFMKSEWSYLEFQTAHNLGVQEGRPKVILILLDETMSRNEEISDNVKAYIIENGYLVCTDTDFWKNLKKKLPRQGKKQKMVNKNIA